MLRRVALSNGREPVKLVEAHTAHTQARSGVDHSRVVIRGNVVAKMPSANSAGLYANSARQLVLAELVNEFSE